jgi:hypothetical protein
MSFKIHLLIVFCITILTYIVWQALQTPPAPPPVVEAKPSHVINVAHATLGAQCGNENADRSSHFDNVLKRVAALCNDKVKCVIPIKSEILGNVSTFSCADRGLEVEYRCFSYDKAWTEKASYGALTLDCEHSDSQQ